MQDTHEIEAVQCLPFTDAGMSRQEMLDHFTDFHAVDATKTRFGSKATKAELVTMHQNDHANESHWIDGKNVSIPRYTTRTNHVVHVHTEVTVESVTGDKTLAQALDKPLTATEKKALTELVNNDFTKVKRDMEQFGHDVLIQRLGEVDGEFSDREDRVKTYVSKIEDIRRKYQQKRDRLRENTKAQYAALKDTAEADGVTLTWGIEYVLDVNSYRRDPNGAQVKGWAEAKRKVTQETEAEQRTALLLLERQRLAQLRQIMLAGVPKETLALLDEVPTATALLQQAATERASQKVSAIASIEAPRHADALRWVCRCGYEDNDSDAFNQHAQDAYDGGDREPHYAV